MIDLARIDMQLAGFGLLTVEEFCTLYNQRFHDTPEMQSALKEWQETYQPVRLERAVRKRLQHFTDLTWHHLPDDLDELIALLEDDDLRASYLAELHKVRTARQLDNWCTIYFMEVNV